MKILGGLKDSEELTHSQLLERLKCESQTECLGCELKARVAIRILSMCACKVELCVNVIDLHIMKEYLSY